MTPAFTIPRSRLGATPHIAGRPDELRIAGVRLDLLAQPTDMHVKRPIGRRDIRVSDAVGEYLSRHGSSRVLGYAPLFQDLLGYMLADTFATTRAIYTLLVGRNLEHIADRTTNVAEAVIYVVTGKTEELN